MLSHLTAMKIARPAGNGIRSNHSQWDQDYPFFMDSNADLFEPFANAGLPFVSDGIIRDAKPSAITTSGRGGIFDLIVNPSAPVFAEIKAGRTFFNGNEAIDLSTGKPNFIGDLWGALQNKNLPSVLLLSAVEQRLPNGAIALMITGINLSALAQAQADGLFDHKVFFTKTSKRKSFVKAYNKTVTYEYRTLRCKPSAVKSWQGRRQTHKTTKSILMDMGIITHPIYTASFDGTADKTTITASQFCRAIKTIY